MEEVLYELTNVQKNILLTEQFFSGTQINNICGTSIIRSVLNFEDLKKALNYLFKNNDAFHLHFRTENSITYQYLSDIEEIDIPIIDIPNEKNIKDLAQKIFQKNYNIYSNNHLFDCVIFRLPNNHGGYILNVHHLIGDSWSLGIFSQKVYAIYQSLQNNSIFEQDTSSYLNYIVDEKNYMTSEKFIKDTEYWNSVFEDIPEIAVLPSKKIINNTVSCSGKRNYYEISGDIFKKISFFCEQNRISIYNFFMAIYSIYINKICNLNNFSIGTLLLNRTNFQQKNTMGMFINTLPFKININSENNFINYSKEIALNSFSMLKHQKYPYQNILKKIREIKPDIPNLYNVLLSYQITTASSDKSLNEIEWLFNNTCPDNLQIHILDLNNIGQLNIYYDYQIDKFESCEIDDMHNRILNIISTVLDDPNIQIKDISLLLKKELDFIKNNLNNTKNNFNNKNTIIDIIENNAIINPDKIAIICNNNSLTYNELNIKSNQLANYLLKNNINSKDIIGITLSRSVDLVVGLLAILKIGATYIPIDPTYPEERILYMLQNSNASAILVDDFTCGNIENIKKINISLNNEFYNNIENIDNLNKKIKLNNLMYLIYTSGSTGNPKGVMITHNNFMNFLLGISNIIDFKNNSNILSLTTISFDIFGLELWGGLANGLTVVMANEDEQNNTNLLNKLCLKNNVQMLQTTPSRISLLLKDTKNLEFLKNLSCIMLGGEPLLPVVVDNVKKYSNCELFNMYGPTETTVWSTIKKIDNSYNISIGKPIANTTCYVLNSDLNILPPYTPGLLYIGGKSVSAGYYNMPDLTLNKFIHNTLNKNELLYNTGDLVYYDNLGELHHLGRNDFQVKLRGYRIELSEIENRISLFPNILENAIIVDNNYLICYYTAKKKINESDLINYLLEYLPDYMIPSDFIILEKMPILPNGKLNRKSLINIQKSNLSIAYPETTTEKILVEIINKITGKEIENIYIPFLALGLDSLGLIQVQTTLLSYNINLTTQHFYKYPSIKKLAEFIDNNSNIYTEKNYEIPDKFKHYPDEILRNYSHFNKEENILGNVFLIGSTGFIGIHILNELLENTKNKIYCLVRGNTEEEIKNKLLNKYKYYFNKNISSLINKKIYIISGDISFDNLNLSLKNQTILKNNINTIINAAGIVKHYGEFSDFEKININGTKNIAEFAFKNNIRLIHLSSISVSGNYLVKQNNSSVEFSENDLYIGQHYEENNYVYSKFEAEKTILNYMNKGLEAQIHRIGIVSGRFSDGFFQENIHENAFYGRIKSILNIAAILDSTLLDKIEFTPVDLCAKAIVTLAKNSITNNKIFNIYNHNLITVSQIIEELNYSNFNIKILNNHSFNNHILNLSKNNSALLSGIANDLTIDSNNLINLNYNYSVKVNSDYTCDYLHLLGFDWPIITQNYLEKIIKHMKDTNFI